MKYFFKNKILKLYYYPPYNNLNFVKVCVHFVRKLFIIKKKMLLLSFDLSFMTYVVLLVGSDAFPSASSVLVVGAKP